MNPEPPNPPPLPEGAQLLTADEAVELIVQGDHPEAARGNLVMDTTLVEMLRAGAMIAARMPDGRLAFAPGPNMHRYYS